MSKNHYDHKDKRVKIPTQEEKGAEKAAPAVKNGPHKLRLPVNPIVERGRDPELWFLNKYDDDQNKDETVDVDVRSLYRHELHNPEALLRRVAKFADLPALPDLFGPPDEIPEEDKPLFFYRHQTPWQNRMIQGDSLLCMTSLLEREAMAGKVQCVYFDPPYGIKFGGNWQIKAHDRAVTDGADVSPQPEVVKAYRDTWELGVHSYLKHLRERFLVIRELLHESGSIFVQISDDNVHLVRCLLDEVFGSQNFVATITYKTRGILGSGDIANQYDYIHWYAKSFDKKKFNPIFIPKGDDFKANYPYMFNSDGEIIKADIDVELNDRLVLADFNSSGLTPSCVFPIEINGQTYYPRNGKSWRTNQSGVEKLIELGRLVGRGNSLYYLQKFTEFPVSRLTNVWTDTSPATEKYYVVQTSTDVIRRCLLMATDPGDLVLDPTCGSGTTAFVAEQWGRRWITMDTSRVALHLARARLVSAKFPYYKLADETEIKRGFVYKTVPHVTLKSLANDLPAETETLYDQPETEKGRLRVSGPFTFETLQSESVVSPESVAEVPSDDRDGFVQRVLDGILSAGVRNGSAAGHAKFVRIDRLSDPYLHAVGVYERGGVPGTAYFYVGPKFSTVSKTDFGAAIKACRHRGDADWLVVLGFAFDGDVANRDVDGGVFTATKVRLADDLLSEGLKKADKKATPAVIIGEPDVSVRYLGDGTAEIELLGTDVYNPQKQRSDARDPKDVACWMIDDDYDGSQFVCRQFFFSGGDKKELDGWKKELAASATVKKNAAKMLKVEIDDEAFARVYGFVSHPIPVGRTVCVRVVSQFGEDSSKILTV